MPKMQTSELTGEALDWAVAHCEGFDTRNNFAVFYALDKHVQDDSFCCMADDAKHAEEQMLGAYPEAMLIAICAVDAYVSTDPETAVPVLEREGIGIQRACKTSKDVQGHWYATIVEGWEAAYPNMANKVRGPDMMTAGLRCYIMGKLGETVNVPDDLFTPEEGA